MFKKPQILTGDFIQDASLKYDQNEPIVAFSFNKEGADLFAKMSSENVGSRFAIVLDGALITAPVFREAITGGSGQISGNFTNESANNSGNYFKIRLSSYFHYYNSRKTSWSLLWEEKV